MSRTRTPVTAARFQRTGPANAQRLRDEYLAEEARLALAPPFGVRCFQGRVTRSLSSLPWRREGESHPQVRFPGLLGFEPSGPAYVPTPPYQPPESRRVLLLMREASCR